MNLKRLYMMVALPLVFCITAFAQDKAVTGKVTDLKDGKPIAGVSIQVKGTKIGTQTSVDGAFSIKVPSTATTLVISHVGFDVQELLIGTGSMNISLVQNSNSTLNDVVVVAYGLRKKGDLTGSITAVTAKDFQKGDIASPEQLLIGKVAGLQITTFGGAAGSGSKIRIRGGASLNASNNPLIVIDGVPVENNDIAGSANYLNTINPNDIESISVLKDASATALYGSRASNGVLIITTKKGVKGKVRYNFNTQLSLAHIEKQVDVLNAAEVTNIINSQAAETGNNTYKDLLGSSNTDWQDVIYQDAIGWNNNVSASGAIHNVPFRVSLGYLSQNGTLQTDYFDRFSSSLNLSPKFFTDHLSVNFNYKISRTGNKFADQGAIGSAITFDPTQPVYADNKYGGYYEWLQADGKPIDLAPKNPLGLLELRDNTSNVTRYIGSLQLDYKFHFLPDLHVMLTLGMDNASGEGNDNIDSTSATNYKTAGRYTHYEQKKRNYLTGLSLMYGTELKSINSKFDVLLSHEYQDFYTEVFNFASYGQDGKEIAGTAPTFPSDKPEYRLESYLGRLNYTLADKYLLTASIRRDATSKFSEDNRVGYFPAVAAAWKIREDFFQNSNVLSELKLRVGWGQTGQQDVGDFYPYLPRYRQSTSTAQYQFGETYYSFLRPSAYDPNIQWESTNTSNIAVDFGFVKQRITGSVDFYIKKTKNLLSTVPIAPGSNFDIALLTNVGNMENKGVEVTVNTIPVKTKNLQWDFGFNFTYNNSEITNLLKQQDPNFKGIDVGRINGGTGNYIGKFAVGYAPYTYYVYKQVYNQDGVPIEGLYEDENRDGKVDDADRYYYKNPAPDVMLGFSTQLVYKQFTFGLAAHAGFGNYLYNNFNSNNGVLRAIENPLSFIGNASSNYLVTNFANNQYLSDYYIENASFFRLDNINLGYNAGKVFNNTASLRINASIQNVFVITDYTGLDPEYAGSDGVDYTIYPRPRIFSLGLNLDF